jgi:hypothetical protein
MRPDAVGGDSLVVARAAGSAERVPVAPRAGAHAHQPAWSARVAWSADEERLVYGLVQLESRTLLLDGLGPL